jgi:hypothetical protein
LEKESLDEELRNRGAGSGSGSGSSSTCMPGALIMSARPGRRYVCGVSNPALASTEKRGTSRELMSSGIPSSRLKDLEKVLRSARYFHPSCRPRWHFPSPDAGTPSSGQKAALALDGCVSTTGLGLSSLLHSHSRSRLFRQPTN